MLFVRCAANIINFCVDKAVGVCLYSENGSKRLGGMYVRFLILFLLVVGCADAQSEDKKLYIYTWADFVPKSVVQQFSRETGIEVSIDYYESNQMLEAQLLTRNAGYDLVFPSAWPYLERQIKNGLHLRLDKSKLPNIRHLDSQILKILSKGDPGNNYAIPYFWGVTGIGYNVDMVRQVLPDVPVDSWATLFDPEVVGKLAKCGVYLLDEPVDVFSAALTYLKLQPNSDDPKDIQQAFTAISKIKPYIRRFDTNRAVSDLANGEVCMIQNWSGDVAIARRRAREAKNGVQIAFAVPREGTSIWIDVVAIPADASHPDNAHKFLNFLMRPQIMAQITNEIEYANANSGSNKYVKKSIYNDPIVYPPRTLLKKAYVSTVSSRAHERLLTRSLLQLKIAK